MPSNNESASRDAVTAGSPGSQAIASNVEVVPPRRAGTGPSGTNSTGTQSLERALAILSAFNSEHPELRVSDLCAITGLGQSTVSRMVAALETQGFLRRDDWSGACSVGPRVIDLAGVGLNHDPVFCQSRQIAQDLAHELDLGANVAERVGRSIFYVCHFEGRRTPRPFTLLGRGGPLHATGLGKVLIHEFNQEQVEALIGATYHAYTPHTITTIDDLMPVLESVRRQGYAVEVEELAFGRQCIAAPIRDRSGVTVAAISLSAPLTVADLTDTDEPFINILLERADQISAALGHFVAH